MKIKTASTFVFLFITLLSACAESERYVSVTLDPTVIVTNDTSGRVVYIFGTNTIEIAEGESGEIVTAEASGSATRPSFSVTKNGVTVAANAPSTFVIGGSAPARGTIVAGPATFSIHTETTTYQPIPLSGIMTVRITPIDFPANKTVTVAPGMGNVSVNLESSTNLALWEPATNGVYSDNLRFFRIKLTKLSP